MGSFVSHRVPRGSPWSHPRDCIIAGVQYNCKHTFKSHRHKLVKATQIQWCDQQCYSVVFVTFIFTWGWGVEWGNDTLYVQRT